MLEAIKTEDRNCHKPKIRRKILKIPLKPPRELEKEIPIKHENWFTVTLDS